MRGRLALAVLTAISSAGCDSRDHIAGPFYLTTAEMREDTALFRCLENGGCARDTLPDVTAYAAGGDDRYVVLVGHPREGTEIEPQIDWSASAYFYFHRLPTETRGWGPNPEQIKGPLTKAEFERAKAELGLPPFSVVLDDLARSGTL
jgi:hypothetical protein